MTRRVLNTFADRSFITGVMLSGEKGSGKSLLAKNISVEAQKNNLPTIIINEPFCGTDFNEFISDIEQPCILFFDEFEKVYSNDPDQEALLTLLDGTVFSKKLILFTCNNRYNLNHNLTNRPGRIFYFLNFEGLSTKFIEEYANDNLVNKENVKSVMILTKSFQNFNFDMLKALIEEMNRYDEPANDSIKYLNINSMLDGGILEYDLKAFTLNSENIEISYPDNFCFNPLIGDIHITCIDGDKVILSPSDIIDISDSRRKVVYKNKSGWSATFEAKLQTFYHPF